MKTSRAFTPDFRVKMGFAREAKTCVTPASDDVHPVCHPFRCRDVRRRARRLLFVLLFDFVCEPLIAFAGAAADELEDGL